MSLVTPPQEHARINNSKKNTEIPAGFVMTVSKYLKKSVKSRKGCLLAGDQNTLSKKYVFYHAPEGGILTKTRKVSCS
jgi:uncharacterized UPF0146 family protein